MSIRRLESYLPNNESSTGAALRAVPDALWIVLLVSLPVTSLPFLVHLTRGAIVAGASGLPLAVLAIGWYLPWLWRNRKLPSEATPLIAFGLIALAAGLLALFLEIHPFKNETVIGRGSEALATLSLGVAYFLITATFVADRRGRLRSSPRPRPPWPRARPGASARSTAANPGPSNTSTAWESQ